MKLKDQIRQFLHQHNNIPGRETRKEITKEYFKKTPALKNLSFWIARAQKYPEHGYKGTQTKHRDK